MVEGETLLVLLFCARCQRSASAWQPDLLQEATVICNEQLHKKAVRLRASRHSFQGAPGSRDLYVECLPAGPE